MTVDLYQTGHFCWLLGSKIGFRLLTFLNLWLRVKLLLPVMEKTWKKWQRNRILCFASIGHFVSKIAELFIQATSLHHIFMEVVSAFCMCLPGCLASGALARYLVAGASVPLLVDAAGLAHSPFPLLDFGLLPILDVGPHFILLRTSLPAHQKLLCRGRSSHSRRGDSRGG